MRRAKQGYNNGNKNQFGLYTKTDCTGVELDGFYCTFKECITLDQTLMIDRIFMIPYLGSVS